jgi:hypothetical protein
LVALLPSVVGRAADLQVEVLPLFNGAPLIFDSITNVTAAGQVISVTRLDFLLSDFALRRSDGTWIGQTNWFAYVNAREGRTRFPLNGILAAHYNRVRFHVGLAPDINHKDPANYSAAHPLNPDVNGLHWGWMGGYVFLAFEGRRLTPDGKRSGYSYHLATDRQLMTVELPVALDVSSGCGLQVLLNVDKIFAGPNAITLNETTVTTHSRTNDMLATQLRENGRVCCGRDAFHRLPSLFLAKQQPQRKNQGRGGARSARRHAVPPCHFNFLPASGLATG